MIESTKTYMGENKNILQFAGELFQNVGIKINSSDVAVDSSTGKKILKAGTVVSKDGKIVDGTNVTNDKAFGLVYRDIDLTLSNGTETIPVTVFGFINESTLPAEVPSDAKEAMKMLMFL
jgi:monomeric isocitrate dehydrogenase